MADSLRQGLWERSLQAIEEGDAVRGAEGCHGDLDLSFHQRLITLGRHGRTTHLHFGAAEGKFSSRIRNWKIVLWDTSPKARIRIDGAQRKSPVSPETELLVIDLPNRDSAIDISVVGGV